MADQNNTEPEEKYPRSVYGKIVFFFLFHIPIILIIPILPILIPKETKKTHPMSEKRKDSIRIINADLECDCSKAG